MALPVTITDARSFNQNSYGGPFKAPNQAVYFVAERADQSKMEVYKATDPTDSFSAQDITGISVEVAGAQSVWAYLSGSEIHIVTADGIDTDIFHHVFDTASDTWTTIDEVIETGLKGGAAANRAVSVAVRSDGDVIALYTGEPDTDMGNPYERVDYARKEVGSWTAGIDVGGTTPVDEDRVGSVVVRGSGDNMHLFWTHPADTNELRGTTLDSTNGLGTTRTLSLMTTPAVHAWCPGVAWNDGGTWRIVVPVEDADTGELVVVRWVESSGDLAASPGTTVVGSPEDVLIANATPIACGAIDGGDGQMYLMWGGGGAAGVDADLYRDDAAPDFTSWSGETEVIDATTINRISCNVYPRNGGTKLAFVYDEAGTIKYNEVSIAAPTAPAFADARIWDGGVPALLHNYRIGPFKGP